MVWFGGDPGFQHEHNVSGLKLCTGNGGSSRIGRERMSFNWATGSRLTLIPALVRVWFPFTNGVLEMLSLHAGDFVHIDYPFAKYDIQNPDYTYSQDEYSRLLEGIFCSCIHAFIGTETDMLGLQTRIGQRKRLIICLIL